MLDVSGYGKNEKQAIESLKVSVEEYLRYTLHKKTLLEDLRAHGWTIKKKTRPFIVPELTDILSKNEYLHDIVNNKPYRMDRMNVNMPQCATIFHDLVMPDTFYNFDALKFYEEF